MAASTPSTRPPAASVTADVVNGLVEGDHNTVTINYNNYYGAVATPGGAAPSPVLRAASILPAPFTDFLDRTDQSGDLLLAVRQRTPAEVSGQPGIGKSALLRSTCRQVDAAAFPSGIVYFEHQGQPVEDVLQFLFASFYDAPEGFKPVGAHLLRYLQPVNALVIVDDLTLERSDVDYLRNSAPNCTFILADERGEMTEGSSIGLAGLPEDISRQLVELRLKRPLSDSEQAPANELWKALGGNPLLLIQAAGIVTSGRATLSEVAAKVNTDGASQVGIEAVAACTPDERHLLAMLATLGDAPIQQEHLEAIAGPPATTEALRSLSERGLVQSHSPSFTTPSNVAASLQIDGSAETLDRVVEWSGASPPRSLLGGASLIEHAMETAAEAERWVDVIELARRIERELAASGRWGAWRSVLERALSASRRSGDGIHAGWALHQLGTRSLGLEEFEKSRELLSEAASVRLSAGDQAGMAVTQQNIKVLGQLKVNARPTLRATGKPGRVSWHLPLLVVGSIAALVLATVVALAVTGGQPLSPTLAVSGLDPGSIGEGATGISVVVTGSGFEQSISVDAGPGVTVGPPSSLSNTRLEMSIGVASSASLGRRDVTFKESGNRHFTCANCLTITPAPVINLLRPNLAGQGATNLDVRVTGINFDDGAKLTFDPGGVAIAQSSRSGGGGLDVMISVDQSALPAVRDVTITNPDGGTSTCGACFTVTPGPRILGAKPNTVQAGSRGQITFFGTGFAKGAVIGLSGGHVTVREAYVASSTQFVVLIDVASDSAPGPISATLVNPDAGSGRCDNCLAVVPAPTPSTIP